ncbi:Fe-Superoxide dismutase [mine drainage metagenome]|uniref:Superoxide dismutase [Fe] n=1 Tax=mine drainage metagenome TaxID=410659 RepID=T1BM43_9ZZZZ
MSHELPPLPYAEDALEPYLSRKTLEFHHGKHHQAYVDNLNRLVAGTEFDNQPLEKIIQKAQGPVFNNAAQVLNHTFYFAGLGPQKHSEPQGELARAMKSGFGSIDDFRKLFTEKAAGLFGSGWAWLVLQKDGRLAIVQTANADTPIRQGTDRPILTCDVWEHAYYIDYHNARPKYLDSFWHLVNWDFVGRNFSS